MTTTLEDYETIKAALISVAASEAGKEVAAKPASPKVETKDAQLGTVPSDKTDVATEFSPAEVYIYV